MARTCCPDGYIYVDSTGYYYDSVFGYIAVINPGVVSGRCAQFFNRGFGQNPVDPIDCPCCPAGSNWDLKFGSCVDVAGNITSDVPCPCCPDGFIFYNFSNAAYPNGICAKPPVFRNSDATPTIPCISCDCVAPPERECADCGTAGLPITFSLNSAIKNCTSCTPADENNPPCIGTFLSSLYTDPVINFTLKNKNFI